jgi:DNA modification methylase
VIRILTGDCITVMRALPAGSVHVCVTSPPYFGLRKYSDDPAELGRETLHDCLAWARGEPPCGVCYVCHLRAVFAEVWRVLRDDGTAWLVLGDSYAGSWGNYGARKGNQRSRIATRWHRPAYEDPGEGWDGLPPTASVPGLKPKDLIMIPARVALALQADGWYLRGEITWAKKAPMPESVTDRPTAATERIYLLAKEERYFYDNVAVMEPHKKEHLSRYGYAFWPEGTKEASGNGRPGNAANTSGMKLPNPAGRNQRNFWLLSPEPLSLPHYAAYPSEIPRRAILAGTSERGCCPKCGAGWKRIMERESGKIGPATDHYINRVPRPDDRSYTRATYANTQVFRNSISLAPNGSGGQTTAWRPSCSCGVDSTSPAVVLDPFGGSGTTAIAADRLGRDCILIELNPEYVKMAEQRIRNDAGMFASVEVLP